MCRTWKRSVVAVLFAVAFALSTPKVAHAFHAGNVFDKPAGAGGGGGIFYTGAAKEHGWNCTACHTESPGAISVTLTSDPPELLRTFRFNPGKTYAFIATLKGEHVGAGPSNFNSLVVSFVGASGGAAGEITGYGADEFYASGPSLIASAGQQPGVSQWSFKWTAPSAPTKVQLHLGAVDGNGANGEGGGTLTDPFGDDVFVGTLALDSRAMSERPRPLGMGLATGALACALAWRRRGVRK